MTRRPIPGLPRFSVGAVVFDLDDTLFDHMSSARVGLRSWLETLGIDLSEQLERAWFAAEHRAHRRWLEGRIGWAEQRRERLREFLPLIGRMPGADDELDALFETGYLVAYQNAWVGFDDVGDCLQLLTDRGFSLAVLTNGSESQQRAKLQKLGIIDRVGLVFTAEGISLPKPQAAAFLHVCSALSLPPELVLYVGDDYVIDVEGARLAGMQAVHLDRRGAMRGESLNSLSELNALLELRLIATH